MSALLNVIGALAFVASFGLLAVGSCVLVWERQERRRMARRAALVAATEDAALHDEANYGAYLLTKDRAMGIHHRLPKQRRTA